MELPNLNQETISAILEAYDAICLGGEVEGHPALDVRMHTVVPKLLEERGSRCIAICNDAPYQFGGTQFPGRFVFSQQLGAIHMLYETVGTSFGEHERHQDQVRIMKEHFYEELARILDGG